MVDGVDWNYGLMNLPSKEMLISTLGDFYKTLEAEADVLEGFYQECENSEEALTQYFPEGMEKL